MYIPNYPEDSVLRRHFESAAEVNRQARLREPPTDSTLRRHYDQMRQVAAGIPGFQAQEAPRGAGKETTPGAGLRSPAEPPRGGGLFAWLRGLFGGPSGR